MAKNAKMRKLEIDRPLGGGNNYFRPQTRAKEYFYINPQ